MKNGPKAGKTLGIAHLGIHKYLIFHLSIVMETLTALVFWVLYCMHPNSLLPEDFYYPLLLNSMQHTFPFIFSIGQIFFFARKEINTFNLKIDEMEAHEVGMPFVFLVGTAYACFIVFSSLVRGQWPYPVLNLMTRFQLGLIIVGGTVFALTVSYILNQVTFKVAKTIRTRNIGRKIK